MQWADVCGRKDASLVTRRVLWACQIAFIVIAFAAMLVLLYDAMKVLRKALVLLDWYIRTIFGVAVTKKVVFLWLEVRYEMAVRAVKTGICRLPSVAHAIGAQWCITDVGCSRGDVSCRLREAYEQLGAAVRYSALLLLLCY